MPNIDPVRRVAAALAWVLGSAAGWALVPVVLSVPTQGLTTYREVLLALPAYLFLGAAAGAVIGLWQALAWRLLGRPARRWLWATSAGYALALPAGLIIFTLLPLLFGLRTGFPFALPWRVPGSLTYYPLPTALLEGGFLAGLCQWMALRFILDRPTPAMRLLWIFGVWLGIGLGPFTGGAVTTLVLHGSSEGLQPVLLGLAWGATIGLVSAGTLWILLRERPDTRGLPTQGPANVAALGNNRPYRRR